MRQGAGQPRPAEATGRPLFAPCLVEQPSGYLSFDDKGAVLLENARQRLVKDGGVFREPVYGMIADNHLEATLTKYEAEPILDALVEDGLELRPF